jgi:alpha-beta hydrolase superfamily lysophospholipase
MNKREGQFTDRGERTIYYQYWEPDTIPRAVIILVHGAAEHSGRYDRFAGYFTDHGYAVAALDHPGHGRSEGTRVHIDRFDDYIDALERFHEQVNNDFPGVPQFLLGHSLGGLISARYLLRHQARFVGCVLSGPAIMTELEPGLVQTWMIRLFSMVAPRMGALQLDASGVSRDPAEVERYLKDPLVYNGKMTARLVSELFSAMQDIHQRAGEIQLPLLLLHGGADAMTAPAGSAFMHDSVNSTDKQLKIYPGLFHEIFNEPEYESVFADVLSWCDDKLPRLPASNHP